MDELVRTRAYKNLAKLRKQLQSKIKSAGIEDRALRGLPLLRRKKAVTVTCFAIRMVGNAPTSKAKKKY